MKLRNHSSFILPLTNTLRLAGIVMLAGITWATAADKTWTGTTSSDVSATNNWSPSGEPGKKDNLLFGNVTRTTVNFDSAATTEVSNITFNSGAAAYTITGYSGFGHLQLNNIYNLSTSTQIFDIALRFVNDTNIDVVAQNGVIRFNNTLSTNKSANRLTFSGQSGVVLGNSNIISSGINLTLDGTTTLYLNDTTQSFASLTVTGNSILDFGGTNISSLTLNTITVNTGATLTVTNWAGDPGDFRVLTSPSTATLGRISFDGFPSGAKWDLTNGVTPVPEPATTGAMILGGGLALVGLLRAIKRRRE